MERAARDPVQAGIAPPDRCASDAAPAHLARRRVAPAPEPGGLSTAALASRLPVAPTASPQDPHMQPKGPAGALETSTCETDEKEDPSCEDRTGSGATTTDRASSAGSSCAVRGPGRRGGRRTRPPLATHRPPGSLGRRLAGLAVGSSADRAACALRPGRDRGGGIPPARHGAGRRPRAHAPLTCWHHPGEHGPAHAEPNATGFGATGFGATRHGARYGPTARRLTRGAAASGAVAGRQTTTVAT